MYDIANSKLTHAGPKEETADDATAATDSTDGIYFFTKKNCPNCKAAKPLLAKAGVQYTELLVEENEDLARSFGLKQAPTLVVVSGGNAVKYAGVAGVKTFVTGI